MPRVVPSISYETVTYVTAWCTACNDRLGAAKVKYDRGESTLCVFVEPHTCLDWRKDAKAD